MSNDLILRGRSTPGSGEAYRTVKVGDNGELVGINRYQELALRGKVFSASRAAVTVPVNANNLVSVFGIYNPPSSGVLLDLFEVEAHYVVATTVVNALGVYFSTIALSAAATFTTQAQASVINARLDEGPAASARFYSAVTHSGTPALKAIVGGWGAVTDGGSTPVRKNFGGRILIPEGVLVSLAMTTAASTATGVTLDAHWAEIPKVAI